MLYCRLFSLWFFIFILGIFAMPALAELEDIQGQQFENTQNLPAASVSSGATGQVDDWIEENIGDLNQKGKKTAATRKEREALIPEIVIAPLAAGCFVDWENGIIASTSEISVVYDSKNPLRDKALAVRKASLQARKSLFDMLYNLALDGRRTVGTTLPLKSLDAIRSFLQNSKLSLRESPTVGGGVSVMATATIRLRNECAELLLPADEPFLSGVPESISLSSSSLPETKQDKEKIEYRSSMATLGGFSGLVLDAQGFGLVPALLPTVVDPSGKMAYGAFQISRNDVVAWGASLYTSNSFSDAIKIRSGDSPLRVSVLAVSGVNKADIVVSYEDAEFIRSLFKKQDIRDNCRVTILID